MILLASRLKPLGCSCHHLGYAVIALLLLVTGTDTQQIHRRYTKNDIIQGRGPGQAPNHSRPGDPLLIPDAREHPITSRLCVAQPHLCTTHSIEDHKKKKRKINIFASTQASFDWNTTLPQVRSIRSYLVSGLTSVMTGRWKFEYSYRIVSCEGGCCGGVSYVQQNDQ